MRRPQVMLTLAVAVLAVAACTSSSAPGWTYAPPTPAPTPGPSASGSAAPSAGASADASAGASAAPSAAPSDAASAAPSGDASAAPSGGTGEAVQISAASIAFEQPTVTAPAGAPFTIHFNNKDAGVPHNVAIKDATGAVAFKGDVVTGPIEVNYQVPALAAGSYQFICEVHPNMTGTLTVGG